MGPRVQKKQAGELRGGQRDDFPGRAPTGKARARHHQPIRAGKYPPARCELRLTEQGWVVAKALFDASNCHKRAGSAK